LGPLLFTAYVSPVVNIIAKFVFKFHNYADDLLIYTDLGHNNLTAHLDKLCSCLNEIRIWFLINSMLINPDKTETMVVGTPQLLSRYAGNIALNFAGSTIIPTPTLRYLGVTLDSTLSFVPHCNNVASAVRSVVRSIKHIRPSLDIRTATGLAVALGLSKLDYCLSVLAGTSAQNINTLQRAINSLARVVYCKPWFTPASPLLQSLHWLRIESRIKFRVSVLVFRAVNDRLAPYMSDMLSPYAPIRSLRSSGMSLLVIPPSRLKTSSRRFASAGPTIWNTLPVPLRSEHTLCSFRKELKISLFK
jgi:hypothetical protein